MKLVMETPSNSINEPVANQSILSAQFDKRFTEQLNLERMSVTRGHTGSFDESAFIVLKG